MKARAALLLALSLRPTHWADAATAALPPHATVPASAGAECGGGEEGASEQPPSPSASSWPAALLARAAKGQDPYAASSPLSAAAVCRDGVAMVALHHVDPLDQTHDDDASVAANEGGDADIPDRDKYSRSAPGAFRDLPLSTRGPLRIEPVHENGDGALPSAPPMALLTAGWRTDGMDLADAARELMAEEVRLYCLPFLASSSVEDDNVVGSVEGDCNDGAREGMVLEDRQSTTDSNILVERDNGGGGRTAIARQQPYYGRRIAKGLAYYLAKCSFSEGVRSLSCVGLLACGGARGGSLYLVDVTGTHRVRAHAIGKGSFALHRRLAFVDFGKMDCQEGLRALLQLIAMEGGLALSPSDKILLEGAEKNLLKGTADGASSLPTKLAQSKEEDPSPLQKWNLPSNTGVELAVLKSSEGRMRRVRLSSLFSNS